MIEKETRLPCCRQKSLAIIQSNYIPWKGYFDVINRVDEFILLDDVQYTRRDWRNRNLVKTPAGLKWLTIPVETKGHFEAKISQIPIAEKHWYKKHWSLIEHNYSKAPFFKVYKSFFEDLYLSSYEAFLSEVNHRFIVAISNWLGISTKISWSSDFECVEGKNERLISLCKQAGATEYISGPAARGYIQESLFEESGIKVTWMNYTDYPEYNQLFPPFEHGVSIIDLIFNEGPNAKQFMKSFQTTL